MIKTPLKYDIHPDVEAFTFGRDMDLPYNITQMHQVHDVKIAFIDRPDISKEELDGYDALVTNLKGVAIGVRTADCIPVLLYDPVNKVAAAVHSGWRGTLARICSKVVNMMVSKYGSSVKDIVAFIGPGICEDCFQVGEEVAIKFRDAGFDIENIWSFRGPSQKGSLQGGHHINLKRACRETLIDCGVKPENIQTSDLCTYDDNSILYSARKEGIECGRNITSIMIL